MHFKGLFKIKCIFQFVNKYEKFYRVKLLIIGHLSEFFFCIYRKVEIVKKKKNIFNTQFLTQNIYTLGMLKYKYFWNVLAITFKIYNNSFKK